MSRVIDDMVMSALRMTQSCKRPRPITPGLESWEIDEYIERIHKYPETLAAEEIKRVTPKGAVLDCFQIHIGMPTKMLLQALQDAPSGNGFVLSYACNAEVKIPDFLPYPYYVNMKAENGVRVQVANEERLALSATQPWYVEGLRLNSYGRFRDLVERKSYDSYIAVGEGTAVVPFDSLLKVWGARAQVIEDICRFAVATKTPLHLPFVKGHYTQYEGGANGIQYDAGRVGIKCMSGNQPVTTFSSSHPFSFPA